MIRPEYPKTLDFRVMMICCFPLVSQEASVWVFKVLVEKAWEVRGGGVSITGKSTVFPSLTFI